MTTVKLTEIVRQRKLELKRTVEKLSAREMREAIDSLERQGRIVEIVSAKQRLKTIASAYCESPENALVVSLGTGTAIVSVTGDKIEHFGGTGVGGGTLLGLAKHMLGVSTIERLEKLARKGDLRRIDLSVRDIAGGAIGDLPPSTTASNFGKVSADATPEDKALAIMNMIVESIGVLALASARGCGQENIVLTGKLSRQFRFMQEIKRLDFPFGRRFAIPAHADFATAIGAARHASRK
jgi:type II pantothenate kinase